MTMTLTQWHSVVTEHYGSLDNFTDETTVREMLAKAKRSISDDLDMIAVLTHEEDADVRAEFQAAVDRDTILVSEMETWLTTHGLDA